MYIQTDDDHRPPPSARPSLGPASASATAATTCCCSQTPATTNLCPYTNLALTTATAAAAAAPALTPRSNNRYDSCCCCCCPCPWARCVRTRLRTKAWMSLGKSSTCFYGRKGGEEKGAFIILLLLCLFLNTYLNRGACIICGYTHARCASDVGPSVWFDRPPAGE